MISSGTNANETFLKDKPVSPLPADMSVVQEELSGEYLPVHTNFLSLSNSSNPKVTLTSFQKNGYTMSLTFSTQETTAQEFSFNIVYSNTGFASISTPVPAKLNVDATGANSIQILSGNNQTGTLGQPLAEPIKVIVKDITGNPFSGAKVNFAANNGGSVSQSQVTTGSDGIASVSWTLGSIGDSQTLAVTAFKSDNITLLQGSPLTFTATKASGLGPVLSNPRFTSETIVGTLAGGCGSFTVVTFTLYYFSFDYYCASNNIVEGIYFVQWDSHTSGNCSYSDPIGIWGNWVTQIFGTWQCTRTGDNKNGTIKLWVATSMSAKEGKGAPSLIYKIKMKDASGNWSNELSN